MSFDLSDCFLSFQNWGCVIPDFLYISCSSVVFLSRWKVYELFHWLFHVYCIHNKSIYSHCNALNVNMENSRWISYSLFIAIRFTRMYRLVLVMFGVIPIWLLPIDFNGLRDGNWYRSVCVSVYTIDFPLFFHWFGLCSVKTGQLLLTMFCT